VTDDEKENWLNQGQVYRKKTAFFVGEERKPGGPDKKNLKEV